MPISDPAPPVDTVSQPLAQVPRYIAVLPASTNCVMPAMNKH